MIDSTKLKRPQLVLVVDDMEINRDVLGIILEDDYEVIYAEDGFEVLRRMHADEYMQQIPVIVPDFGI